MFDNLLGPIKEIIITAEKKLPYACATFFRNDGIEIRVDRKGESLSAIPSRVGFVLTLFNGEYFQEYATDAIGKDNLLKFCSHAIVETQPRKTRHCPSPGAKCIRSYRTKAKINPGKFSINEKISLMRERRGFTLKGKNVINATVRYHEETGSKVFINRTKEIHERICRLKHDIVVYVSDGKQNKWNFISTGGSGGMENIGIDENRINEMIETANQLLSAEKIQPDFYDVVTTPGITGLIAHEAFGHGVETDMYLKNRARSETYLGKMIASPLVNIIDDPTLPNGYGSYFIDDEGEIAGPTYIIKNGRFVRGLTSMHSRLVLGVPKTANGRRESFERKIYTRMSNTFFKPGQCTRDEMSASIDNGIYLISGLSGMEDPKGWGIQVLVHYGKEIKKGKITDRIFSPVGITGYVPDLLKNVTMVGNDFEVDSGTCGKGHKEWIPVASGGPHIKTRVRLG